MTLLWRKQMEIGNEHIDTDHKYLICLINTVELTLRSPEHRDLVPITLAQLVDYTHTHFQSEESIMLERNYPRYDNHKRQHQLLIGELENLRKKIETKGDASFSAEECAEFATLFRHWLLDHLIKEDMLMKPYLTG